MSKNSSRELIKFDPNNVRLTSRLRTTKCLLQFLFSSLQFSKEFNVEVPVRIQRSLLDEVRHVPRFLARVHSIVLELAFNGANGVAPFEFTKREKQ